MYEETREARETAEVKRIREDYIDKGRTKLERLRKLDDKVRRPADIFAFSFGTAGSLVLGLGMCLAMKVIGDMMGLGIVVGIVGIAMVSVNYFIYRALLKSRKKKYAAQIMALSDELLGGKNA